MKKLITIYLLLLSNLALANDSVFFNGIKMDFPFDSYPKCDRSASFLDNPTCRRGDGLFFEDAGFGRAVIDIAHSEKPAWQNGGVVVHFNSNREIKAFEFLTTGAASQDKVFTELRNRFGRPKNIRYENLVNGLGVQFRAIYASWLTRDGVSITFEGVKENDDGSFNFLKGRIIFDGNR